MMADDTEQKAQDAEWIEKYDISEEQLVELREAFTLFDEDHPGMIEPDNLSDVLRAMGQNPTEAECTEMIKQLDMNELGKVPMEEFVKVVFSNMDLKSNIEMEEDLENALKVFDKQQQGYIEADEFKNMLKTLGETLDDDDIAELMKTAEVDKEGKINYYAFIQTMMSK